MDQQSQPVSHATIGPAAIAAGEVLVILTMNTDKGPAVATKVIGVVTHGLSSSFCERIT